MNRSKQSLGNSSKTVRRKGGTPPSLGSSHKSVNGVAGLLKRSFDVVVSAAALVLLSPLLAAIAAIIRGSDGGTVFYRQTRVGLDRRTFTIVKFRTMQEDAERDLGAIWSVPNDPRCTRFGKHFRRFGLDELPQLWNVLRGDMSLVGPRPERPEFTREFRKEHQNYDIRHTVRPGITGFAQACGWRGYTSLEERLRHDVYYVHNWSFVLDAYVIVLTLLRGWREKTKTGVK